MDTHNRHLSRLLPFILLDVMACEATGYISDNGQPGNRLVDNLEEDPADMGALGLSIRLEKVAGQDQAGAVQTPLGIAPQVRVVDGDGQPVSGEEVRFVVVGEGAAVEESSAQSNDEGVASAGQWILGTSPGEYQLQASLASPDVEPVVFTATAFGESYDIELVYLEEPSPEVGSFFSQAAQVWADAIAGGLPPQDFSEEPIDIAFCTGNYGQGSDARVVDDLVVYVAVEPIDGQGGALAGATPCYIRPDSSLPSVGFIIVDSADITGLQESSDGLTVAVHELGHVLGIGSLWQPLGLLDSPSLDSPGRQNVDTSFQGTEAGTAFAELPGCTPYDGAVVPVENNKAIYGAGSLDGHWREGVLGVELMTPSLNAGVTNPLSTLTLASLTDIGYDINRGVAEAFSCPPSLNNSSAANNGSAAANATSLHLGGDVLPRRYRLGPR